MRLGAARTFALALPEATEEPHADLSSWRVRQEILATIPPGGAALRVCVGSDEVQALVAQDPTADAGIVSGTRVVVDRVQVDLGAAEPAPVEELLAAAWRRKAPERLVAADDAGRSIRTSTCRRRPGGGPRACRGSCCPG